MEEYKCMSCGFVYDPQSGDALSGIVPGTPFEDLPEDYTCPICGVRKEGFIKLEE